MASKATVPANREQNPETVRMQAGWGDIREVIPEMVEPLKSQGWVEVTENNPVEETTDEARR
jgi:hypothetical protein